MHGRWLAGRSSRALMVPLLTVGVLAGAGPGAASAATCLSWTGAQPQDPGSASNLFNAVTVLSPCRAWAVGSYSSAGTSSQTLIERWNGIAWAQQAGASPGGSANINDLDGVSATSSSNAWAVGAYSNGTADQTLIEHWNGSIWAQVPSPDPGGATNLNTLTGVTATSSTSAWAVGYYVPPNVGAQPLIEHWNGSKWKQVPGPGLGAGNSGALRAVAATSASNAWAVGDFSNGTADQTLIEHWNGSRWKRVASPDPGGSASFNSLRGVSVTSSRNAWAVGDYQSAGKVLPIAEHWNGTRWKQEASPKPGSSVDALSGVTAISATDAWAVGSFAPSASGAPLLEHWNGTRWKQEASPNPADGSALNGIAGSSATNIWAVGRYFTTTASQTFAVHCC
jgi:hypothetical protein